MTQPVKIVEISDTDWMKGISVHPYSPVGGLFQQATNFDPFQKVGVYIPTPTPTQFNSVAITVDINSMVIHTSSGAGGINLIDAFGVGTRLYRINTNLGTITDISSRIAVSGERGAIIYKNKTIYSSGSFAVANNYPITAINNEVTLVSLAGGKGPQAMHIGPDRNLYITNDNNIARVTSVTGTAGNASQYLTFESDVITRGIDDDGINLVIAGDTNFNNLTTGGRHRCFIAFWNMKSQDLTRIWEFTDDTVLGIVTVVNDVVIICTENIYICSINSRPEVLLPIKGNASFSGVFPFSLINPLPIVKKDNGTVLWGFGKQLMGYGRLHPSLPKTLFTGYTIPDHSGFSSVSSMIYNNLGATYPLWVGTANTNRLYAFSTTTSQTSTTKIAGIDLKKPYEFSFAKVILSEKLASGQSVDLEIKTDEGNNTVLKDTKDSANPFSFTQVGGKKSHIFYPEALSLSASSIAVFEDLSDIQIRNIGANIRRVEIWAKPLKEDQDIYK